MSRRRITVTDHGRSIVVRGWKSKELLADAGIKGVFSGAVSGWLVAAKRLPDLVAYAEYRNITVNHAESPAGGFKGVRLTHPLEAPDGGDAG